MPVGQPTGMAPAWPQVTPSPELLVTREGTPALHTRAPRALCEACLLLARASLEICCRGPWWRCWLACLSQSSHWGLSSRPAPSGPPAAVKGPLARG